MSKLFYRRYLPHWQPQESTYFITFRLAGSVPMHIIRMFQEERLAAEKLLRTNESLCKTEISQQIYNGHKRHFGKLDSWLDKNDNEPYWLRQPEIAEITAKSLHFFDEQFFRIWSYTIMPNHVHLLLTTLPDCPELFRVLQRMKGVFCPKIKRNTQTKRAILGNRKLRPYRQRLG